MRMRYVLFLSLIMPLSMGAYASIFQSVALIKWPWPDKEFAFLLRTGKVNEMIAKAQLPDPFEESWEGSVHNLIYDDYDVTRGAKYQIKNRENNRREIKFTGWVFTAKRLSLSIKNRKLVSCQVMEVFGQSINLTMDVFDGSSVYPHTLSNCKDWIGKFEER